MNSCKVSFAGKLCAYFIGMIGQVLDHYRILEKIGAGGMGVVYLAQDENLQRKVAIKILPPGLLISNARRRRFRQEALALARLNHPNIATIYEFGSQDGVDFLVTEYITGLTLDAKLARGALPEREVISLGMQLASGVAVAHQQGVLHRDLKPANLRLTAEGRLKILDFGLAQIAQPNGSATSAPTETANLSVSGTLPYISPEQIQQEKPDPCNDVWSVGVVLYEMATASLPFHGRNSYELMSAIVRDEPQPLPAHLSPGLSRVIEHCLVKEVRGRYQSASEVVAALEVLTTTSSDTASGRILIEPPDASGRVRRPSKRTYLALSILLLAGLASLLFQDLKSKRAVPGAKHIDSLAVLPFTNLTGDPGQQYFVDGMTNVLITDLAKLGALKRVIAVESVMPYKDTKKSVPQIAQELGVDSLVTGAVLRSGSEFEITAQLVDPQTQSAVWSNDYRRQLRDIVALQSEMASAIARASKLEVTPAEQVELNHRTRENPDAYMLYLKGRYYWNKRNQEGLQKAYDFFRQALDKDPTYALAYVGLADTYLSFASYGIEDASDSLLKAKAAAMKALEIDGQLAEAHVSLGAVKIMDHFDWESAQRELDVAVQLDPNNAEANLWQSILAASLGRLDAEMRSARRAQELDPLSPNVSSYVGFAYYLARRYDEAVLQYKKTLELDPRFVLTYIFLGLAYAQQGKFEQAIAAEKQAVDLEGGGLDALPMLAYAYAAAGQRPKAASLLKRLEPLPRSSKVQPNDLALVYSALHQPDRAFHYLNLAYEEGSLGTVPIKTEPALDGLRSDRRFRELLVRAGIPTDN